MPNPWVSLRHEDMKEQLKKGLEEEEEERKTKILKTLLKAIFQRCFHFPLEKLNFPKWKTKA
jgi:hypothetical protein